MTAGLGSWCCHLAAARTALGVKVSNGCKPFVPEAVEYNKESHRTMKLFSRRTDNGFHNSRQVAKCRGRRGDEI